MTAPCFTPALLAFLVDLRDHNDRDWFKANQARYERDVREPARAFVRAMAPRLAGVAPHLQADDRKVGGSLMRPQRDTRFANDKTPYKTNVGIQFRHDAGKDVHAPGLYLHLDPDGAFMGLGLWRPEADALRSIRERIVAEPRAFEVAARGPEVVGHLRQGDADDRLKTAPRGFDKDHPLLDDLRLKSHILVADLHLDDAWSADLPDRLTDLTRRGAPHAAFLCGAIGLDW